MRRFRGALAVLPVLLLLSQSTPAADLRQAGDAPLHAVQFVDRMEGWAVGAEGIVWHSIDGGKSWERQPTGTRATLRALHFLTPYTGYVVGREEMPHGAGSIGIVLMTTDGGLKWSKVSDKQLPGLNAVRFFDERRGLVAGDGSDQFPTGVFVTTDGGASWHAAPGPRCPTWVACDFSDAQTGALAGAWSRLGTLREGVFTPADVDKLGGRSVLDVKLQGQRAIAVGQGGLVLVSRDSAGAKWAFADLRLPADVGACCDLRGVALRESKVWAVGRPGTLVFFSDDFGKRWEGLPTGQQVPLNAIQFIDDQNGWAVGELGTILGTTDGGQSWKVQRRGGQRAAVAFVHGRATGAPLDTVAAVGGDEGYLTTALLVATADPATAAPKLASEPYRWTAAQRRAGGAVGEALWQFPLPQFALSAARSDLMSVWDRAHGGRARALLLRQLVLELRLWQPEVVVTDFAGEPLETTLVEVLREAFDRAADGSAFPEQTAILKLPPWRAKKLYTRWDGPGSASVIVNGAEPRRRLDDAARDFAAPAWSLLTDQPVPLPAERSYRLLAASIPGAERHGDLMAGIALAAGGTARRMLPDAGPDPERVAEVEKSLRERRNLQALSQPDWTKLADTGALLAQIGPLLDKLPADQGASAALNLANQYARVGQWHLAREAYLLMVDRFPAHPLSADAYRWLARYHGSSEARRREELGQFLVVTKSEVKATGFASSRDTALPLGPGTSGEQSLTETVKERQRILLSDHAAARRWYQGALLIQPRLAAFGPMFANDPAIQFCLNSSRRQLGDLDAARFWNRRFLAQQRGEGDDPWRLAAAAELWLIERTGLPPKPVAYCRQAVAKPYLDGKLDDECWKDLTPLTLKPATGTLGEAYSAKAWLAYDAEYLYVAVQCAHPPDRYAPPVAKRERDADLRAYDRVSIMLDLDRDYQTYYHLQIDQRGALAEDCWGDRSWDPRWFVAHTSTKDGWIAETAIPLAELTGDGVSLNKAWACNIVRVLPGKGVQAWSLPADAQMRPEGMGLLMFSGEKVSAEPRKLPPLPDK